MPRMLAAQSGTLRHAPAPKEPATRGDGAGAGANEGVAWNSALSALDRYFERVLQDALDLAVAGRRIAREYRRRCRRRRCRPATSSSSATWRFGVMFELLGGFMRRAPAARRGAPASCTSCSRAEAVDPAFAPQPFTGFYQQSLFQGAHKLLGAHRRDAAQEAADAAPSRCARASRAIVDDEARIDKRLRDIAARKLELDRVRVHGDLHLGQILDTGDDFVIIDFEGEPGRPLNERRYKRCPLVDVAGMMRSFHYASESALRSGRLRVEDAAALLRRGRSAWTRGCARATSTSTCTPVGAARFVPAERRANKRVMLEFYQLEKCIYEIRYELNNRPDWVEIPLAGLRQADGGGGLVNSHRCSQWTVAAVACSARPTSTSSTKARTLGCTTSSARA